MSRKTKGVILGVWLAAGLALYAPPIRAELKLGHQVGNLQFSGTISPADQAYLGLPGPGAFTLQDISSPYVMVQVFSTMCPHCIRQAPVMNQVYHRLTQNPRLNAAVKMLAVGNYANRSSLETWRRNFQVPYPLIPDLKARVGADLEVPGTPTVVILDKQGKVVFFQGGEFKSARAFINKVAARLNL